jgi:hypothetical protein
MIGRLVVTSTKRRKGGVGGREKEFLFEENKNFNNHVQYLPIKFQLFFIKIPFIHPQNIQLHLALLVTNNAQIEVEEG